MEIENGNICILSIFLISISFEVKVHVGPI